MLSNFSKVVIFLVISLLAVYITLLQHPISFSEIITESKNLVHPPQDTILLRKEVDEEAPLTSTTDEQKVKNEGIAQVVQKTDTVAPKVTEESKHQVYETLAVHHSDTDDESYRPLISPCVRPMGYKIGVFDSQFDLSREKFFQITTDAIKVWEQAAGTSLFTNDQSGGTLTLNLIYDERQATTVSLGYLALEIENTKQAAGDTRTAYEREKVSYINDSEIFNKEATEFQQKYANYNEKVGDYNKKGGATKAEYDAMMLELDALKKESEQFELRRKDLTRRMEEVNSRVKRYNELVEYANGLIRRSNSIGSRTFTEGRFVPSSNTIDIYQYSDEVKLRRVLIHEFGHALGIGHVENVQSIMYSFNSGTSTSLSEEDKEALKDVCKTR